MGKSEVKTLVGEEKGFRLPIRIGLFSVLINFIIITLIIYKT